MHNHSRSYSETRLDNLKSNAVPRRPEFRTVEGERAWRKHILIVALRTFGDKGYDAGLAGHFTVRDPEWPDRFWVNPMDQHLSLMADEDLVLVGHDGAIHAGHRPANSGAFSVHAAIHAARPDIIASIHTHLTYSKILAMGGDIIQPTTQDSCVFYDDIALYDVYDGVPGEKRIGEEIAAVMGKKNSVIMKHHGALTVGPSVEAAAFLFLELEKCAQDQILAEQRYGKAPEMAPTVARKVHDYLTSPQALWLSFQSEYALTCHRHGLRFTPPQAECRARRHSQPADEVWLDR
jgi:ribulose-5-phosphate 4-epimerase/fuculose-1-phosphate aldolase